MLHNMPSMYTKENWGKSLWTIVCETDNFILPSTLMIQLWVNYNWITKVSLSNLSYKPYYLPPFPYLGN